MTRIAFVCVSLRAGGAERVISILANELCEDNEVTIITLRKTKPFYFLDKKIRLIQNSNRIRPRTWMLYFPLLFIFLAKALLRARPLYILSFGETISSFVIAAQAFRPARTLVFHRANPEVSTRGARSVLNPIFFRFASCLVFQTETARKSLEKKYYFAKTRVLPNPVRQVFNQTNILNRPKTIVSSGYLGDEKNQAALIRSFSKCENRQGWRLRFLGDGPDREVLEALVLELRLEDCVEFLGYTDDVYKQLDKAQIFGFTSLTEGFPNALAEALAAGCACISYNCPVGPSDLIAPGSNGILVHCGDEIAFTSELDALLVDEDRRVSLSENARESVKEFDHHAVANDLRTLLREQG